MKRTYVLLACGIISTAVCLVSYLCRAQEEIIVDGEIVLSKAMVDEDITNVQNIVISGNLRDKGKNEPVRATQLLTFVRNFDRLEKIPEIEKATGYSREWIADMRKLLAAMAKNKAVMETALLNRNENAYSEASTEYEKIRKIFLDTVKKPKRASGKKY